MTFCMFSFQAISRIHGAPCKNIYSNAYLIINSTIQDVEADIYTKLMTAAWIDIPTKFMTECIFQKELSKRKPYCQVEKVLTKDNNRIPYEITHVKLINKKDICSCRPVVKKITYLEKEPELNKEFQQKLYRIKQKKFIVAFEAFHVKTN